jgi:hypothetical protein
MAAPTPQVMTQPLPPPGELYGDQRDETDERFGRERDSRVAALPQESRRPREARLVSIHRSGDELFVRYRLG